MIKQKYRISKMFWVQLVSKYEVKKMIKDSKNNKSVGGGGNSDNSDWVRKQVFYECRTSRLIKLTFHQFLRKINL